MIKFKFKIKAKHNTLTLRSELKLDSVRFIADMSISELTSIYDLNNLKSRINIRMPNSSIEYNLVVNFSLNIQNSTDSKYGN